MPAPRLKWCCPPVGAGLGAVQRQRRGRVAADAAVDGAPKAAEPRQRGDALPRDVRGARGRRQPGPAQRHVAVDGLRNMQVPISARCQWGAVCVCQMIAAAADVAQQVVKQPFRWLRQPGIPCASSNALTASGWWRCSDAEAPRFPLRRACLCAPLAESPIRASGRCHSLQAKPDPALHGACRQQLITCRTRAWGLPWSTVAASSAQGVAGSTLDRTETTLLFLTKPSRTMPSCLWKTASRLRSRPHAT